MKRTLRILQNIVFFNRNSLFVVRKPYVTLCEYRSLSFVILQLSRHLNKLRLSCFVKILHFSSLCRNINYSYEKSTKNTIEFCFLLYKFGFPLAQTLGEDRFLSFVTLQPSRHLSKLRLNCVVKILRLMSLCRNITHSNEKSTKNTIENCFLLQKFGFRRAQTLREDRSLSFVTLQPSRHLNKLRLNCLVKIQHLSSLCRNITYSNEKSTKNTIENCFLLQKFGFRRAQTLREDRSLSFVILQASRLLNKLRLNCVVKIQRLMSLWRNITHSNEKSTKNTIEDGVMQQKFGFLLAQTLREDRSSSIVILQPSRQLNKLRLNCLVKILHLWSLCRNIFYSNEKSTKNIIEYCFTQQIFGFRRAQTLREDRSLSFVTLQPSRHSNRLRLNCLAKILHLSSLCHNITYSNEKSTKNTIEDGVFQQKFGFLLAQTLREDRSLSIVILQPSRHLNKLSLNCLVKILH